MNYSESSIRVRYAETDQMGIVYHANYYVWFEVARADYLRKYNYTYKEMEQNGIIMPVIETHCKYKIPARYDDLINIRAEIKELNGAKITFRYSVIRFSDEAVLAEGETVHAFTDQNKKPFNLKRKNPSLYSILASTAV